MGHIIKPLPVSLIIGLISNDTDILHKTEKELEKKFGCIESKTALSDFKETDYYEKEMGKDLKREFLCFKKLIDSEALVKIKLFTNKLEKRFACKNGFRKINIDPGYISMSKLVLATTKNFAHRLYMCHGIFEEITLYYSGSSFTAGKWTYPDYKNEKHVAFFNSARNSYKKKIEEKYGPSQIYRSV